MDPFLKSALAYAQGRWCWDDTEFLREQYEDLNPPRPGENPVQWVNYLAEQYGLDDPNTVRSTPTPDWTRLSFDPDVAVSQLPPGAVVTVRDLDGRMILSYTVPDRDGSYPTAESLDELCVHLAATT